MRFFHYVLASLDKDFLITHVIQHSLHGRVFYGCTHFPWHYPYGMVTLVIAQIVLNDKIPNPQDTTQGAIVRMVTIFTLVTYPLHFRLTLLRLKGEISNRIIKTKQLWTR
jgi:hypothetical protein